MDFGQFGSFEKGSTIVPGVGNKSNKNNELLSKSNTEFMHEEA